MVSWKYGKCCPPPPCTQATAGRCLPSTETMTGTDRVTRDALLAGLLCWQHTIGRAIMLPTHYWQGHYATNTLLAGLLCWQHTIGRATMLPTHYWRGPLCYQHTIGRATMLLTHYRRNFYDSGHVPNTSINVLVLCSCG